MIVLHFDDISEELQWPTREVQCMRRCRKTFAHNLLLQWEAFNGVMGSSGHLQPLKKGTNTHILLFLFCFVWFCHMLPTCLFSASFTSSSLSLESQILIGEKLTWKCARERCEWYETLVKRVTSLHFITLEKEGVVRMNWHKFFPGF